MTTPQLPVLNPTKSVNTLRRNLLRIHEAIVTGNDAEAKKLVLLSLATHSMVSEDVKRAMSTLIQIAQFGPEVDPARTLTPEERCGVGYAIGLAVGRYQAAAAARVALELLQQFSVVEVDVDPTITAIVGG